MLIPAANRMPPPRNFNAAEKKMWVRLRDTLANGFIPTPVDAEIFGQLCVAKVRVDEYARLARLKGKKKVPWSRIDERHWNREYRYLLNKCKFLRDPKNKIEPPEPENPFVELIKVDYARIDKKLRSKHVDAMNKYARDVVDGKRPASRLVRKACQRHLDDLERVGSKDFPYKFSSYLAHRACELIERLPHVKGRWAKTHQLLKLEPWQCFLVCSLFGWVHVETNARRFRETYWEICRKNGKSILAAAIGIVLFCADDEHGAEVYSGATSEKQAWEVFRPARLMLLQTPQLLKAAGVEVNAKSIVREADGSRFEPVIGKPGDGPSPSCAIVDEFHEHDTADLVDTMETGMLAREQPLLLKITTAGYNIGGPCYEHRTKALQVLNGALIDEALFVVIHGIDPPDPSTDDKGDDWAAESSLAKANPNLGVSVDRDFLIAKQRSAVVNVSEQTKFKTKHLDVWCAARTAWVSLTQWQAAGDTQLTEQELYGEDCWFTFDLASKLDVAAFMKIFCRRINDVNHYYVFGKYYVPEDQVLNPSKNQLMYQKWHRRGILTVTDGATTDFETIRDDIVADAKRCDPVEVVYDPFNATHMSQLLLDEGLTLVEFTQKPVNFAVPMDEVQAALKDGRLHHDGNEMLTWMMANVTVRPAKKGLFWPTKESPEAKIDGPVAMIMGIARALNNDGGSAIMDQFIQEPIVA